MSNNISNFRDIQKTTNTMPSQQQQQLAGEKTRKYEVNTTWMIPDIDCWIQVGIEEAGIEIMYAQAKIKQRVTSNGDSAINNRMSMNNKSQEVEIKDVRDANYRNITKMAVENVHQVNQLFDHGYNDMVEMDHLNEAEILINLQRRYSQDLIYTFIGPTLVVMNPYKPIGNLFSKQVLSQYQQAAKQEGHIDYKKIAPHTYAVAAQSYCKLFERERNQAIVISGESGAGKTENAKTCMSFLTGFSGLEPSRSSSFSDKHHPPQNQSNQLSSNIEDRILGCNPILEAFGNAKTVRNDNSSRFGKFVQIQVGKNSRKIKGATIANYLLEKSRVTTPGQGERNYHIFYHLLYSGQQELLQKLHLIDELSQPESINYLRTSRCFTVPTLDDAVLFQEVQQAFSTMGISDEEQDTIYRIISAILLLGNVDFDGSTLTDTQPCRVKQENLLHTISTLLKVDYQSILYTINTVTRKIGSSIIHSPKKLDETISSRDSIARNLYDRMFSWIVARLNGAINLVTQKGPSSLQKTQNDNEIQLGIGLLDIFGFEVFDENSFEQFCINFTNEKLQQLYIQYVFKSEEQEFINEGLSNFINQLGYKDNQNIIYVLDNPIGIFQLIDESSALSSSDDKKLYDNIYMRYNGKPEVRFSLKGAKKIFTIVHTAKPVDYSIEGFKEKNKAEISQELSLTIAESNDPILSSIFLGIQERSSKQEKIALINQQQALTKGSKENKFLGCKFRVQMKQLMDELISADCHFIRCIKPNEVKKSNYFLQGYVLIQIKYLGVLQAILSRKEGFPYRKDFKVFFQQFSGMVEKYRSLNLQKIESQNLDLKNICVDILKIKFDNNLSNQLLIGKTKFFTKDEFGKIIDDMLFKWYEQKKVFLKKIISQYQVYTFRKTLYFNMEFLKKAIKTFQKIQATFKMKKQRQKFLKIKEGTASIFHLLGKKLIKQFLKQWNMKVKQIIIAKRALERQKAEDEVIRKQEEEVSRKQNEAEEEAARKKRQEEQQNTQNKEREIQECQKDIEGQTAIQQQQGQQYVTIEKKNDYSSVLSSEYATISNYNTFNAANNNNNYEEIKDNYKALSDNYQSSKGEADMSEKMKQEYQQIQEQNRQILDTNFDTQQQNVVKTKSKVEYFLNLDNPRIIKPPPSEKSKDCFIDFSACNKTTIDKIEQNNFFEICSQLIATRRKNMNEVYTMKERMQYEKKSISKPLTNIYKPYEPAAVKAFSYMLKYAGDKAYEEEHPRVIAWKLLQLLLEQNEQDVTDEIFLQVIKQLTNNTGNNLEQYFKLAALISSCVIMSPRIVFPVMNFFYEQSNYYSEKGQTRFTEWCKYILSRIGNSQNFDENDQLSQFIFKREEMPLKEEFISIENMNSIQFCVHFYGDRIKYYKVESYVKVCSLVSIIGLDLQIINSNPNWYGLVEYLTIDGVTTTQILDFGMRILDWKAKKYRERQQFIQSNPGRSYDYKIYYQFIILHTNLNQDIDTNLMMYQTYANEFLYNIYFFDIQQKEDDDISKQIKTNNVQCLQNDIQYTEIDFIVELAAIKIIADFKIYKKEYIKLNQCMPQSKQVLLNPDVWRVKIEDQIEKLLPILKTQRKARSYFLQRMKFYQGKYFFTQKFYCKFSKCESTSSEYEGETASVCLTKLGYVYILQMQTKKELETISYRDIKDFSMNYSSQSLFLHTKLFSYQIVSSFSLNIYYNITQYCTIIEDIDNSIRMGIGDNLFLYQNSSEELKAKTSQTSSKNNQKQINQEEYQESFNTTSKLTNDNILSESKIADYNSTFPNQQNNQYNQDSDQYSNNNQTPDSSPEKTFANNLKNGNHIPDYSSSQKNGSLDEQSPNSQFSSGQNKLLSQMKRTDQIKLEGTKSNLSKQFQNLDDNNTSNLDQTSRSNNLYENLI